MTAAPVKGVSSTLPWWCSSSTEAMVPYSYQSLIMMPYSDLAEFNTNTTTTTPSYFEPDWWNMTPPPTQNEIQQALAVPKLENFMEDSHSHPPPLLPPSSSSSFGGGCGAAHSQTESSSSLTNVYNNNNNDDHQTVKIPPFEGSMSGGSRVMPTTNYNNNTTTNELYHHHHPLAISPSPQPNSMITAPNNSEPQLSNSRKLITTSTNNVTFGQRTSIYRGVTRHRWTGRYEAHLWDNSYRKEGQARKGRQVYLGGYDMEEKAARSYDLAALKYWGPTATTNFSVADYTNEMKDMENVTRQEFIASLRRKSSGFSRGASIYRGVTRHHQQGRWQARIGRVAGNKDLYLGTFGTEEEAAEAYDIAAIKFRGLNAVTNFEMSRYDVEAIANSSLPIGGSAAKRLKFSLETEPAAESLLLDQRQHESNSSSTSTVAVSTVALSHLSHAYNPGSISGSSSDSTCSNTTAGPLVVFPSPEFCSRNFLYSFGDYVNFNHNPPSKADYQPWNVVPLSN